MLVVFEIDENVLRPEAAQLLAERETLWVFCKTYRVLDGWEIEGADAASTKITAPPPPVALVPPPEKPNKRTTARKIRP